MLLKHKSYQFDFESNMTTSRSQSQSHDSVKIGIHCARSPEIAKKKNWGINVNYIYQHHQQNQTSNGKFYLSQAKFIVHQILTPIREASVYCGTLLEEKENISFQKMTFKMSPGIMV